jgi:hypothetical protein
MAVSQSLEGIAAALKAESTGPSSPQHKTSTITGGMIYHALWGEIRRDISPALAQRHV